ncbi:NAD(P)/FAD-dependent oxidoreductase [Alkaliphilus hydrothermalis]|uniref:Flavin-dependent dehydrogenase n=1 Tax=Alkaliphilus hydrothermalis TaxID=1482730 RepID=A0ABS2NQP8_9FIRM|nr:NAD(P)/FAD-dependent oxidoreductase [Alkaliphilus hydrothermalis]MBM7615259.1 flavin-dependent dehydrogenase [Alkaliphilus hydrothermalis]
MKVAIMGAGLSGIACGITLEREGIPFDIYEKRSQVDDRFVNGEIFLNILNLPKKDCIHYMTEEWGINLKPAGHIKELVLYSENEKAVIQGGNIGFNVVRGRHQQSIANQMRSQLKTPIQFNSKHTYEELLDKYTHVVLATGDGDYSKRLGNYQEDLTVTLNGLILRGEFDRYTTMAWLDNTIAPKGYCYFIPLSSTEANLVVAYPDYPDSQAYDSNVLVEKLHSKLKEELQQPLEVLDQFQITKYIIGICKTPRIGNTFFVGNCFGAIMPFLGFGQFTAIMTGVYAAEDIGGKGKYAELVKDLKRSYEDSLVLRRGMEGLDNSQFDFIVRHLKGETGNKILNSSKIDIMKFASTLLKPFVKEHR